jgi:hypothetical protein
MLTPPPTHLYLVDAETTLEKDFLVLVGAYTVTVAAANL